MKKNGLMSLVLMVILFLWTLLIWGISGLLNGLSVLVKSDAGQQAVSSVREGMLLLVPQNVLDAWLPWLLTLWRELMTFYPGLVFFSGYVLWLIWGLGVILLLGLAIVGVRLMHRNL